MQRIIGIRGRRQACVRRRQPGWREGTGPDQRMVNRGVDIITHLYSRLVSQQSFKAGRVRRADPRPFVRRVDATACLFSASISPFVGTPLRSRALKAKVLIGLGHPHRAHQAPQFLGRR